MSFVVPAPFLQVLNGGGGRFGQLGQVEAGWQEGGQADPAFFWLLSPSLPSSLLSFACVL